MSKRKLSQRQQRQTEQQQQKRQQRATGKSRGKKDIELDGLGPEQQGLLIANHGPRVEVEAEDGTVQRCVLRQNLPALTVGDRVVWQQAKEGNGAVVTALLERKSLLARPGHAGELRPAAANLDQLLIVAAVEPDYSNGLIDQYLAAAELSGIEPVLVFNKTDLITDENRGPIEHLLQCYRDIGYTVIMTSCKQHDGLEQLREQLKDKISAAVGQSGVGKSSLARELLPDVEIGVGELSEQSGLGQHTTSTARLYQLPSGGRIIDSPGVREFRLWEMDCAELIHGFRELSPYQGECKFRNCRHQEEPGCALHEAEEQGNITTERLESYRRLCQQQSETSR